MESPWLTAQEAADYARRHLNTINTALRTGKLAGERPHERARWLIHKDALERYIKGEPAVIKQPVITRRRAS